MKEPICELLDTMMKRLLAWLGHNSSQLQALAAIVAILAGVVAVPFFLYNRSTTDLTITVTSDEPLVPPALEEWLREAKSVLRRIPSAPDGAPDPYHLRELQRTGPLDPTRSRSSWPTLDLPGRLRVEVTNSTAREIPGVRIRLDRIDASWGLELTADFLTAEEVTDWQNALSIGGERAVIILPELPPLPPHSSVSVIAYGDIAYTGVSATVPTASFKVVRTVLVQDSGLIALLLRPGPWLPLLVLLVSMTGGIFALLYIAVVRRVKPNITYDLACLEAKAGRNESALALLQEAVKAGYSNFQHMRSNADLEPLRKLEAFEKLVGS